MIQVPVMIPVLQLVKNTKHTLPCIPSIIVLVNQFLEIKISIQFVVLAQLQEFALGSFVGSIFSTNQIKKETNGISPGIRPFGEKRLKIFVFHLLLQFIPFLVDACLLVCKAFF